MSKETSADEYIVLHQEKRFTVFDELGIGRAAPELSTPTGDILFKVIVPRTKGREATEQKWKAMKNAEREKNAPKKREEPTPTVPAILSTHDAPKYNPGEVAALPNVRLRDSFQKVWLTLTPEEIIGSLFDDTDLLKVVSGVGEGVHSAKELRGSFKLYERISCNPVQSKQDPQAKERRYVAVQIPSNPSIIDSQWKRLHFLSTQLSMPVAIWDAARMSVTALYDCKGVSHAALQDFALAALTLDCDPATLRANYMLPIPGNVSKAPASGAWQRLRESGLDVGDADSVRMRNFVLWYQPPGKS